MGEGRSKLNLLALSVEWGWAYNLRIPGITVGGQNKLLDGNPDTSTVVSTAYHALRIPGADCECDPARHSIDLPDILYHPCFLELGTPCLLDQIPCPNLTQYHLSRKSQQDNALQDLRIRESIADELLPPDSLSFHFVKP